MIYRKLKFEIEKKNWKTNENKREILTERRVVESVDGVQSYILYQILPLFFWYFC